MHSVHEYVSRKLKLGFTVVLFNCLHDIATFCLECDCHKNRVTTTSTTTTEATTPIRKLIYCLFVLVLEKVLFYVRNFVAIRRRQLFGEMEKMAGLTRLLCIALYFPSNQYWLLNVEWHQGSYFDNIKQWVKGCQMSR